MSGQRNEELCYCHTQKVEKRRRSGDRPNQTALLSDKIGHPMTWIAIGSVVAVDYSLMSDER
jgi:hypothetical protein